MIKILQIPENIRTSLKSYKTKDIAILSMSIRYNQQGLTKYAQTGFISLFAYFAFSTTHLSSKL